MDNPKESINSEDIPRHKWHIYLHNLENYLQQQLTPMSIGHEDSIMFFYLLNFQAKDSFKLRIYMPLARFVGR